MQPSTSGLYASSIAIVSGIYSLLSAGAAANADSPVMSGMLGGLGVGGAVMLVLGGVVLVHGAVLLTPASTRIRRSSGPLMILWAVIMLGNQALLATVSGWGMSGSAGGGMGMGSMVAGWDPGMVAVAVLMLASGLIMVARSTDAM